jgi:hypothetical protein
LIQKVAASSRNIAETVRPQLFLQSIVMRFGGLIMAQFTNRDKSIIMQEQAMWIVADILREQAASVNHTWQARIRKLSEESRQIAQELRDHNEQFEELDDDE